MSTVLARHDLKRALVAVRRDENSQAVACGRGENSRRLQNRRAARSLPVMTLAALRAAVIYLYTRRAVACWMSGSIRVNVVLDM
jgi:hypothetical protein